MTADPTYSLTRRRGKKATVTVFSDAGFSFDVETGEQTGGETTYTVRFMVKEDTRYSRIMRANTVESNIGDTTFIMWLRDVKANFTRLDGEDFITFAGLRYDVVTSVIEDTGLVITATQAKRE